MLPGRRHPVGATETHPCKTCRRVLLVKDAFYPPGRTRHGTLKFSWECIECSNARQRVQKEQIRRKLQAIKLAAGCQRCGRHPTHPRELEFDHLPGYEKSRAVCQLVTSSTLDRALAEAAKCQVLCIPCHLAVTAERRRLGVLIERAIPAVQPAEQMSLWEETGLIRR